MLYVCKHFKPEEYLPVGFTDASVIDWRILQVADEVRELIGHPITINAYGRNWCGYRTPDCKIGAPKSLHRLGKALDLHCAEVSAEDMRKKILEASLNGAFANLGRMEADVSWCHIDLGPRKDGNVYLFKA